METQNQNISMNYPRDQNFWVTEPEFKPGVWTQPCSCLSRHKMYSVPLSALELFKITPYLIYKPFYSHSLYEW